MAHQGKKLPPEVIARLRRLTSVCRLGGSLSIRQAARETDTAKSTVQKYVEKSLAK